MRAEQSSGAGAGEVVGFASPESARFVLISGASIDIRAV